MSGIASPFVNIEEAHATLALAQKRRREANLDVRLGYTEQQREWIIVTSGACVSVFSKHEPEIREAIWPAKV